MIVLCANPVLKDTVYCILPPVSAIHSQGHLVDAADLWNCVLLARSTLASFIHSGLAGHNWPNLH